jgi:hypothetical protein
MRILKPQIIFLDFLEELLDLIRLGLTLDVLDVQPGPLVLSVFEEMMTALDVE